MPRQSQPCRDWFTSCILFQQSSTELVVFCPMVGQIVTIAWPIRNDNRILAHQLRGWLRKRGLHLACFCPLVTGLSVSCQIVHGRNDSVKAFCTDSPPKCGFYLDLTRIQHSALLTNEYKHLPILASERLPEMDDVVLAFRTSASAKEGPYFEGYCGEHISHHPGIEQKAGSFRYDDIDINGSASPTINSRVVRSRQRTIMNLESATLAMVAEVHHQQYSTSVASTRIKRNPWLPFSGPPAVQTAVLASVAGPSSTCQCRPNSCERNTLEKICSGQGVSSFKIQGLLEQCGFCELYFTGSVLRSHILGCSRP